jgi:DNA polymerase-3 subunit gamma/tau
MLSQNAQVVSLDDETLTLALVNAGARDSFVSSRSHEYVQQALHDVLGVTWRIDTIVDPSADPARNQAQSAASSAPKGVTSPETVRDAARETVPETAVDDPDAAAHPDDPVVDTGDDPEQLLSRELGAQVIGDNDD